ncbi:penicillin-binding protein 2 [uncultured Sneathiella sp.]|jgi:penicillin-binding protein 2|uniref:penicillin-binding protein 2 n=1 Tax=uncultured Sneathiella sp. TaxID=879315 RepID=UPI0030D8E71F|tara:strand:- start:14756 stop:16669 length:1914 start_codon:yes stop_codon:yes gene_type:complete
MAKDQHKEKGRVFSRRALMMAGGQAVLMSALAGRLYYLQVIHSDEYSMMADENRMNLRLLPPLRGRIVDRFGTEIASNRHNYRVILIPEQTASIEATLDALGHFVPPESIDRERVLKDAKRKRSFVPIPVVDNLTWDQFARINVNAPDLPGIQVDVGSTRDYPYAKLFAHIVGYVGAVSEKDLQNQEYDPLLELPEFRIGKSGVEKYYDRTLRGKAGLSRLEANAYGRVIRELNREEGIPGNDAVLTIDKQLQEFAVRRMGEESAAAVVIDIHSGDILSMVSVPSFDPNNFASGISSADWKELVENPKRPLGNKAIAGQYPPGSTFKMIVALAALEAGVITSGHEVFCGGHTQLGKHRFHCWKRGGHGKLKLEDAISQSCDIYFYDIARKVGVDKIAEMAHRFGLGEKLGIDILGERAGLIPTKAWKQAVQGVSWQLGETYNTGIGQGYVLTTPLQLAVMTARLANGGKKVNPRLVRSVTGQTLEGAVLPPVDDEAANRDIGVSQSALKTVLSGMNKVVNGPRGSARAAKIQVEGWEMAGKTGTAQVRRISRKERIEGVRKSDEKPWEERDHALFVGFAPYDDPRYAVSVIVEHGGSGSGAAAPIARDLLQETLRLDPLRRPSYDIAIRRPAGGGDV